MNIKLIRKIEELDQYIASVADKTTGLVPTMGNLHAGHISLVQESLKHNEITFVSIFVNPTQFGPNEDYDSYPRTLEADIEKIKASLNEDDQVVIYAPDSPKEIYGKNFSTTISLGSMTEVLCGKSRPTHFDGVTTVVYMLFAIFKPTNAYFGQKDFQQLSIIKKMNEDMRLGIKITGLPIIRDEEGLALSSRNQYMNSDQRKEALILPNTLNKIYRSLENLNKSELLKTYQQLLDQEKKTSSRWEYLEIYDAETLSTPSQQTSHFRVLGALKLDSVRLIDNRNISYKS